MAIIRWDPFREMVTLREKMNRLFEDAVVGQDDRELVASTWSPAVDIYETEHEIVLKAELPGIEDDNIAVKLEDNTLTLKGERQFEKEPTNELVAWIVQLKLHPNSIGQLEEEGFIYTEKTFVGPRRRDYYKLNESFNKYLAELLWQ